VAGTLARIGDTQHASGEPGKAVAAWTSAREIFRALGHPDAEALDVKVGDAKSGR
jgi:hypothetical protein